MGSSIRTFAQIEFVHKPVLVFDILYFIYSPAPCTFSTGATQCIRKHLDYKVSQELNMPIQESIHRGAFVLFQFNNLVLFCSTYARLISIRLYL